jgi:nitrate reductase delta subunit
MGVVMENGLYSMLAGLFEYPREDYKIRVEECIKGMEASGRYANAVEELKHFRHELEDISLDDIQGVFSYTFELTSDYTLDLGYHLFDGFKRTNKLASIKGMYRAQGFPVDELSKGELPDHLPIILKFLAFTKEEALKKDFMETFVVLAVERLQKNFDRNKQNIYSHLINAIFNVIERDVKEGK